MTQSETKIRNEISIAWNKRGRLFRNQRYKGQIVRNGSIVTGYVDAGIGGDGGADLIGFTTITVTPDMVGCELAVFTAIETKAENGRATDAQRHFVETVRKSGGIAGICRTVAEAEALIHQGQFLFLRGI